MTDIATAATPAVDPASYGVGARFSLHPMTDDFVRVILGALAAARSPGLEIETDDVSTFVRGGETELLAYLTDVIGGVGRTGVHTAAHVLLSRGCPGEVACEVAGGAAQAPERIERPAPSGVRASAHWSLYPLDDGPGADHMAGIEAAIAHARDLGVLAGSVHFATRLEGDLTDVLAAALEGWLLVGRTVRHVTSHLSLSLNSPTEVAR